MSEERMETEKRKEPIVNKNRKKKKRIVAIIILAVALLAVIIGVIFVLKYRAEHRYIPFEKLDEEQIVFVREDINENTIGWAGHFWAYDISGRKYTIKFQVEEYGQFEELRNAIIDGETVDNDLAQVEVIENYVSVTKVEEMYENLLQVNRRAKYRKVSDIIVLDTGSTYFYGVRFLQNGEVEYINIWSDTDYSGKDLLDDPYAIDICNWMLWL